VHAHGALVQSRGDAPRRVPGVSTQKKEPLPLFQTALLAPASFFCLCLSVSLCIHACGLPFLCGPIACKRTVSRGINTHNFFHFPHHQKRATNDQIHQAQHDLDWSTADREQTRISRPSFLCDPKRRAAAVIVHEHSEEIQAWDSRASIPLIQRPPRASLALSAAQCLRVRDRPHHTTRIHWPLRDT
jgi:hypothetical protein